MKTLATSAKEMISGMKPHLQSDVYVFVTKAHPCITERFVSDALCIFEEDEGVSMIMSVANAERRGFATDQRMRCITLKVFSSLEGVGLTAAVSSALAAKGIACNVVAAFHHDHLFVPEARAQEAMGILKELQRQANNA
ncbi:hypothetical protein BXY66_1842 [Shimia isoporae]|uniref:Uncharacterized protein n=1 Tax=Shimia isoporae TaxID=647720 RepID=A0A4R1NWX3_9RHOB|nr:ACT domain-containing protein [Shimia isoporae]TCL09778.1 hypothetical protein BXY66_1842 [Shimia isoporae]